MLKGKEMEMENRRSYRVEIRHGRGGWTKGERERERELSEGQGQIRWHGEIKMRGELLSTE